MLLLALVLLLLGAVQNGVQVLPGDVDRVVVLRVQLARRGRLRVFFEVIFELVRDPLHLLDLGLVDVGQQVRTRVRRIVVARPQHVQIREALVEQVVPLAAVGPELLLRGDRGDRLPV